MSRHEDARQILKRTVAMVRLTHSVESHLMADQAEALAPAGGNAGSGSSNDISDPTGRAVISGALARFAHADVVLTKALSGVDRALIEAQRAYESVLSDRTPHVDTEPRCAGWNDELRAKLGGCGKVLESWKDAAGVGHTRSTYLCIGCRRAAERAERADEAA